jgi:hypothetical protein
MTRQPQNNGVVSTRVEQIGQAGWAQVVGRESYHTCAAMSRRQWNVSRSHGIGSTRLGDVACLE